MSPTDHNLIERKLKQISDRIVHLERYEKEGWEAYKDNFERKKTTEKLLQEIIESAIDINTHVLVETQGIVPDDYYASFIKMSEVKWISEKLATDLAPSAGLRNRLVHQYSLIDDQKVFDSMKIASKLFRLYISEIRKK